MWMPCVCTGNGPYVGATVDSAFLVDDPMRDAVRWDRKLAMTGCLPDSFEVFLHALGYPHSASPGVRKTVSAKLRDHTMQMFRKYWKLNSAQSTLLDPHSVPFVEQLHSTVFQDA